MNVQTHLFIYMYCNSGNYRVIIFAGSIFVVIYYSRFQQLGREKEASKISRHTQSIEVSVLKVCISV